MSQVQQNMMCLTGCEDPQQQGYTVETHEVAPTYAITHTFNAPVKGYTSNNGYYHDTGHTGIDHWTSADLLATALYSHGILGYVYVPTETNSRSLHTGIMGDMTRLPRKHDIYLLRAQTDQWHNGLYIVQGTHALGGHWTGAIQLTLMRLDPRAHTSDNPTFGGDAHYSATHHLAGNWPGVHLSTTGTLVDGSVGGTVEPTINSDGNLVFHETAAAVAGLNTEGRREYWLNELKSHMNSNRQTEHVDTQTVDRYVQVTYNTDPLVNRLWKFEANSWNTTGGGPMIWYPVEQSDVIYAKLVNDELHVSGGKLFDLNDPDHADYSFSTLFGGDVPDIVHNGPDSVVIEVTQQTDVRKNGYYRWDIDGSDNPTTSRVGAVGGTGGYYAYRRFVKLPYYNYWLRLPIVGEMVDLSVNITSPQGAYKATASSPNPQDNSQYTWALGGGAPLLLPPVPSDPINQYVTTTSGLLYAPTTSSGRIEGVRDIHAEEAEISSIVFYAARNSNMTHHNELVARGLKVEIDDLFHRLSLPVGGDSRHTQKPGIIIPLEFNRTFTRVHRSSLMFDTLDLKQVMDYRFVYADTGEALSDEHARTVGRVYLTMNYKGYFM